MQYVTTIRKNGWHLVALSHDERSPLADHSPLEIAADPVSRVFYAFDTFLRTYGLVSVVRACESYPVEKTQ